MMLLMLLTRMMYGWNQKDIFGRREITLRNHTIGQVNVQWKNVSLEEATWELESNMQDAYPILF